MKSGWKSLVSLLAGTLFCGLLISYGVTEEVPIGRIEGRITMEENGRPLGHSLISLTLITHGEDEASKPRVAETNADGSFHISNLPTGDYAVDLSAHEHSLKRKRILIEEGKTQSLDLKAEPNSPSLSLYASQRVFTPEESPKVELHGFVPDNVVNVGVYRLKLDAVAKSGGLQEALSPVTNLSGPQQMAKLRNFSDKIADLSHPVTKRDAEGAFIEAVPVGHLDEGFYYIITSTADCHAATCLNVTHLALVTKTSKGKSLCFATDLVSGQPVANAEVMAQGRDGLQTLGHTDNKGLADITLPAHEATNAAIVAKSGKSFALVGFEASNQNSDKTLIVGYCERPAYRPGDQVHFKGIARRFAEDGYALPGEGETQVEVKDPDGNIIQRLTLPISAHGTFNGQFTTSSEGKPGGYNVVCRAYGAESNSIFANVVAYRKPEYSVDVKPVKPYYVMGEKAEATVEVKYYYGGPVVGARVKASIYRSPAWESDSGDEDDNDPVLAHFEGGEYSEKVDAVTDASGKAHIVFDTKADNDPDVFLNDYIYNVSVEVSEDEAKTFEGSGEVRVVRGNYELSTTVQNPVVAPGEKIDLLVKTTDVLDKHKPVPNRKVTIEAGREEWTRRTSVFITRQTFTVVTGADGTVHLSYPAPPNEPVSFRSTSVDDTGHSVVASGWAYVEGSPAMAAKRKGSMKLTLDHRRYVPGGQAKALLQTDVPGGQALVCVQAKGILWHQVAPITSTSTIVTLPVTKEDAPNAYVTVAYVKDKHFLTSSQVLKVDRKDRDLQVVVTPDRTTYKPGETAQVTVKTLDSTGQPIAADVSLGVVDEGIYAIEPDSTNLKDAFYPRRSNDVETNYSFPDIYLDGGDKGSSKVPLRKNFRDTAQWVPEIWTGPTGTATVPITLPDNLTSWRATAVAITDDSQVGMSHVNFQAKKDLMVRLELPQFMVAGDQQRMTVIVANDTGHDQSVHVKLDGTGINVDGGAAAILTVPTGQPKVIAYQVTTPGPGTATLSARAWVDGGPNDGVQQSFPVKPHGRIVIESNAGQGSADFRLPIRKTADPSFGSLEISLNPTLATQLLPTLDKLIGFPYGCVEQTMSRFMPSVLVAKTVQELGLPKPEHLKDLPRISTDAMARLGRMRHEDGGWGWWDYDESTPFMTALVLDGLDRAKSAGFDISSINLQTAFTWSTTRLKEGRKKKPSDKSDVKIEPDALRDRLYLTYALARFGHREVSDVLDHLKVAKLTPTEAATAALAFHEFGRNDEAKACLEQLRKSSQGSEIDAYWASEEGAWGEEPTSLALTAFINIAPDDALVPRIVRHLMRSRKDNQWESTRDTSYAIVGLTGYLSHTRELQVQSTATVSVNGKPVQTVILDPAVIADTNRLISIPKLQLTGDTVHVEITESVPGAGYYTATLKTLDVAPVLAAESSDPGLKIERSFHTLEARALENGTTKLLPSAHEASEYKSGDYVRVRLTVQSDAPRRFVLIDEPTPSSCRVLERDDIGSNEQWNWWWSRTVILDDHLAFFATYLPKGKSVIEYTMRAEQPGKVHVLPTNVANMYDPSRHASSAEAALEVKQ